MSNINNTQNGKSRLMISNMILENFKSYAGSQTIGPFHKRFSSIVGPNGSGKSNVIDALLFVFGKRATQLRLKKVSELIHKSAGFPNLEYARVSVHFQLIYDDEDSEDNYEIVPNSEFVVTRVAYQNNQSKYTIDSKSTTYTEVGQLLRSHGIDLDNNRFLILQGEVEQIAMMKPKAAAPHEEGLLEYLEDIIGSNRFVEKIDEASKSLDEINEQRVEKVNRLKIAEKERDNLSGSKLEAEAFIEKEKEIRRLKNQLYQILEGSVNESIAELVGKQERTNEKLTAERGKLSETEKRLAVIQGEYEKVKAEHDKVNSELDKSSMQYDAFERNDVKLQEDMKHSKANIKKQQTVIAKEAKKEEDCLKEASETTVQMSKYEQLLADFQNKKTEEEAQLEKIMEGLQEATAELRQSLEAAQGKLMVQEKAVASLQTEKESVETAVTLLQTRAATAAKNKAATEEKLAKLRADLAAVTNGAAELDGPKRAALVTAIAATEETIAVCSRQEAKLQTSVREAVTSAEIGKAALTAQQNRSGSNVVVQKLLQATKRGGPLATAGVRGRLGDLATISPEYDVAVSTACGMLDHIVVDNADGAQACINYLREMNLGRASFIALDKIEESVMSRMGTPVRAPAPRLFDLITLADESVRPAFYLALRDTLVAAELDQAVKIAYEGDRAVWRVVTSDGNLIDTSGAMSGGGKEVRSGAMKLSNAATGKGTKVAAAATGDDDDYSPARVKQLEMQVGELQSQLSACRAQKSTAENELINLKKQLKDISTELEKARMAISRFAEQESELLARIAEIARECDLSAEEQAEVQQNQLKLQDIEMEIGKVSPNFRSMQAEVASLQRQILSVGGPKLTKVQQKIDSLTAQLETFSSSLSTKAVEEANSRKQAEKAANLRLKAEQEMAKAEEKLAVLVAQQKEMEADAMVVVNAVEAARARMVGLQEQLQGSSKEYHDLKTHVGKMKSVEIDLTVEMERFASELKELKGTAKKWAQEADAVRRQHIEEQKELLEAVRSVVPLVPRKPAASAESAPSSPMKVCSIGDESVPVSAAGAQEDSADEEIEQLAIFTAEQLQGLDTEEIKRDISAMETQKNKMKNSVNMSALLEYMKKDASYKGRLYELEQVTEARNAVCRTYEDLRRQRLEEFMAGFGVISLKLKEMYQMITLGGDAELELLDSLDPFSEGIVFSVRPPRKSWKNISNLSGGEKTLSSLALVFALHHYKPTPLYVMDEIDAALDFKNVSIVANYIKDRTKNAQFVIISLRNNMFELADRLVGIYKTNDATKSVTINPKLFENATAGNKTGVSSASRASMPLTDVTNTV